MERPLRPAGRLPRPARRPLVRVRATHQGPYRAREGTTGGRSRRVAYGITRVKGFRPPDVHGPRNALSQNGHFRPFLAYLLAFQVLLTC